MSKIILITGASSGIGEACACFLSKKGHLVFGTSRHFPEFQKTEDGFHKIQMDVTDEESINKGIARLLAETGQIDVLINNAGYGITGSIEDTLMEEAKNQFLVNFFGAFAVVKAVLPIMRQKNSGLIINISSLAALYPVPFQSFYNATKSALDSLTESLRMELKSIGSNVKVVSIQPNDYRTNFTKNRRKIKFWKNSDYIEKAKKALKVTEDGERNGPSPIEIAQLVEKIIKEKSPRIYYPIGSNAQALSVTRRILPDKIRQILMMKNFNLK